jgi:Zn-finger nucleic acid-binding protein
MQCPACGSQLAAASIGRDEFYECSACHGTWLDVEPFQKLVKDLERQAAVLVTQMGRGGGEKIIPITHESMLSCPRCRRQMNRYEYAGDSSVHVDVCREHGIWFDHDELRRIIQFLQSRGLQRQGDGQDDRNASPHRSDDDSSWWTWWDLLDFLSDILIYW